MSLCLSVTFGSLVCQSKTGKKQDTHNVLCFEFCLPFILTCLISRSVVDFLYDIYTCRQAPLADEELHFGPAGDDK